jgi:hypothetical protein
MAHNQADTVVLAVGIIGRSKPELIKAVQEFGAGQCQALCADLGSTLDFFKALVEMLEAASARIIVCEAARALANLQS